MDSVELAAEIACLKHDIYDRDCKIAELKEELAKLKKDHCKIKSDLLADVNIAIDELMFSLGEFKESIE